MKKLFLVIAAFALSLTLASCGAEGSEGLVLDSMHADEAEESSIPGAENIELRIEQLGEENVYLYCVDSTAYLFFSLNSVLAAPQYDSLCATNR